MFRHPENSSFTFYLINFLKLSIHKIKSTCPSSKAASAQLSIKYVSQRLQNYIIIKQKEERKKKQKKNKRMLEFRGL